VKFTLGWLREHLEFEAPADEVARRLTMIGHEVEQILDRGRALAAFRVAEVLSVEPHPNADKLKVCLVGDGAEPVQVVCGAPNVRAGMKAVFAPVGSVVPDSGMTLKRAKIRGVESFGMLLSDREMLLSDDHEGIREVRADAPAGAAAAEILGLADPVLDVGITPNRGDCLGVRGLARDLAAAGLGTLKPLRHARVEAAFDSPIGVSLGFSPDAAAACPYFAGRVIRGVRNVESPQWLQARLSAIGLRPISALVDITNYLAYDLCRPLHAFDADRLAGDVHVRLARPGETLAALNGQTYELDAEMTVIADARQAHALGGVIGGTASACDESTRTVFLESALFDPVRTARTGRTLSIHSDARFRFERGIDPEFLIEGLEIATRLVVELCGGQASRLVVGGEPPAPSAPIAFRPQRIGGLTGMAVDAGLAARILDSLGFTGTFAGELWQVSPPSWRNDIDTEACVVEEVARIYGYHHIVEVPMPPPARAPRSPLSPAMRRHATARRVLAERGLTEAVTFSFVSRAQAEPFGGGDLTLVNPISSDLDVMRPSSLPNLVAAAARNADRGTRDVALFEVGPQYAGVAPQEQQTVAAGVRAGRSGPRHWGAEARPVDPFDAKADAQALLQALGVAEDALVLGRDTAAWYHPGRSGVWRLGARGPAVAAFGELHPKVSARLEQRGPLVAFEVFLDALPDRATRSGASGQPFVLPALQPLERDFAFIVAEAVPAAEVLAAVRGARPDLIREVRVFDVFTGAAIGAGKKSVAVSVKLQPTDKTLTDEEIEAIAARIVARVGAATGGILRA
jgi:phenylalanyl-tRNA synthetase beta chain